MLDGLLYTRLATAIVADAADGDVVSDHVFGLCAFLGYRFTPRMPRLDDRRLYAFEPRTTYNAASPLIGERLVPNLVRGQWHELLRLAASIHVGTVSASLMLKRLEFYPRQNRLAAALPEVGRIERTLWTLQWIEDPEIRRATELELYKGEARNALARAVCLHRFGRFRDRSFESQTIAKRSSGGNGSAAAWARRGAEPGLRRRHLVGTQPTCTAPSWPSAPAASSSTVPSSHGWHR